MPLASTKNGGSFTIEGPDGGGKDLLKGSGAFWGKMWEAVKGRNHLGIVDLEIKYIIR